MATYLKRTSKLFDLSLSQASAEMNLRDLMCPVCRGILIEPVTLPCTHNLCLRCLKGTFEHNSLSCPLCRVRVGSWLRTATKSESLVNGALWQLIRSRFPKEIEDKHNDDVTDIDSDAGYAPKILSAAGEIRREYEKQLQIAEDEMRRQRESERIANEELIRKIQEEEEKQKYEQLAQDQLLARSLAKKQLLDKEKNVKQSYNCLKNSTLIAGKYLQPGELSTSGMGGTKTEAPSLRNEDGNLLDIKHSTEPRNCNFNLISKIQAERLALGVKPSIHTKSKDIKSCCEHLTSVHSAVTLKHQPVTMLTHKSSFNYTSEPSCSNSKIYGDQSEEELRVPSDVLNSNKKSLGVEVCVTTGNDDKRIGSAQSAGSHDSINPEIHHFKPIRAMPRTPLKVSQDGRQIDPKLIRVIPILKRISNPIVRPPTSVHMKRIIGCSWSAFKEFIVTGRARQDLRLPECEADWKPPGNPIQGHHQLSKLSRPQASETARKLDLVPNVSFDSNKNYTKSINRLINSTKVSKKLILDDELESNKPTKSKGQLKNGTMTKSRKQKNYFMEADDTEDTSSSSPTANPLPVCSKAEPERYSMDEDGLGAVENIAERIKRRKVTLEGNNSKKIDLTEKMEGSTRKSTRSRAVTIKQTAEDPVDIEEQESPAKLKRKETSSKATNKSKRRRARPETPDEPQETSSSLSQSEEVEERTKDEKKGKRTTRNSVRTKTTNVTLINGDERMDPINPEDLDERVIHEQEQMERLLLQEKEDYELAQRLQAQFNEMERISGRTRGSRRALERNEIATSSSVDEKSKINGKILSTSSAIIARATSKSRRRQRHD